MPSITYKTYGMTLGTNRPLPDLIPLSDPPSVTDVDVCIGTLPSGLRSPDHWKPHTRFVSRRSFDQGDSPWLKILESLDGAFLQLHYKDSLRFTLNAEATRVWVTGSATEDMAQVGAFLLGVVLGLCLRLRGNTCLHASAIAVNSQALVVTGPVGAGKSTTAGILAGRNYPIIADDVSLLIPGETGFTVRPAYPRVRLRPDVAETLCGNGSALPILYDRHSLNLQNGEYVFSLHEVPIKAIYIIIGTGDRVSFSSLSPAQGLKGLMENAYLDYLIDDHIRSSDFQVLGQLVRQVPVRSAVRQKDVSTINDFCDALLEDFRELP